MDAAHDYVTIGSFSALILAILAFFLKRMVSESDRLRMEQSEQIAELAKKIGEFAQEQAIMNDRIIRLLRVDEKYSEIDKKIMQLQEHENFSRRRFHELSNYINGLVGSLMQNGMKVDELFRGEHWKF